MTALLWENVQRYALQIMIMVAAGGLLPYLFRLRSPEWRLRYWQVLLALCLVLPMIQPWRREIVRIQFGAVEEHDPVKTGNAATSRLHMEGAALALIAGGGALRMLWLAVGLFRLRRYRMIATVLEERPVWMETMAADVGARPAISITRDIGGPVTFGFFRPVVLLPERFTGMPEDKQHAVVCHELLHVRRRDWAYTLAEEVAGALLWFHPAVWWLIARIRLTREQTVDNEAVRLLGRREPYVEALLAIAGWKGHLDVAPAALFMRKRHLVQRVNSLLQEAIMSKGHLVRCLASSALVLLVAGWFTIHTVPLKAAPDVEVTTTPSSRVTAETGGLKLLHRPPLVYAKDAKAKQIEGTVTLELSVDADGNVADARVLSGPEELRKSALQSVLEWHYSKPAAPAKVQVSVDYKLTAEGKAEPPSPSMIQRVPGNLNVLKKIDTESLPAALREALQPKLVRFEGRALDNDLLNEVRNEVWSVDKHIMMGFRLGEIVLKLHGPPDPIIASPIGTQQSNGSASQRIRVGGNVQAAKVLDMVKPVYPPLAKQARIQGTTRFNVTIDREGRVSEVEPVAGHPLLVPAAMEAVRQWTYQQTYLNGNPVEVVTVVDVNFTLLPE